MLPTKYLDDLKNAPVDKVDFVATFFEVSIDNFLLDSVSDKGPRCLRVVTRQWARAQHYILAQSELS